MTSSKCVLNINLNNILMNYRSIGNICDGSKIGAVVKANCYGLGIHKIATSLHHDGCKDFFVANCEEGMILRQILTENVNIYVLNGVFADELDFFKEFNLIPVLNYLEQIYIWHGFAIKLGTKLACIIHIDTGMHRLGMVEKEFDIFTAVGFPLLDIRYIMSHLASSEDPDNKFNEAQLEKFTRMTGKLPTIKKSLANSGSIFLGKNYHFDLVRPGAALYGINSTVLSASTIKNSIGLFAPIIQIHELLPGESVGYYSQYTNNDTKSCLIATIPIGYADGLFKILSSKAVTYVNGCKAPILGLISMDLTVIDVSLVPSEYLYIGQKVEIIGHNSNLGTIAKLALTNEYEILTRLGQRFKRIYI